MEASNKTAFGIFIKALHKEADGTQFGFVADFFKAFGIKEIGGESVLKNWMAGRNQGYRYFFKGGKIKQEHYDEALNFLNERIGTRYTNIQKSLKINEAQYTYVDFETDNQDEFFKSILNQFRDIVGLPLDHAAGVVKRNSTIINSSEKASKTRTSSELMIEKFESLINEYRIAYFMCSELTNSQRISDFTEAVKYEILAKFVNDQETDTYKTISEFNKELYGFSITLEWLDPSSMRSFFFDTLFLNTQEIYLYDIYTQMEKDRDRLRKRRDELHNEEMQSKEELEVEEELRQLYITESLLDMYSTIHTLYSRLCNGKTLLVC